MIPNPLSRGALLLALAVASAACRSTKVTPMQPDPMPPSTTTSAAPIAAAPTAATSEPDAGYAGALSLLAPGSNALGLDVYRAVKKGRVNVALSPLSISMALTMTWAGARGETAAQMKNVLHAADTADATLEVEAKVMAWIRDPAQKVTLRTANRLFGEKSYAFERPYLEQTSRAFGAALEPLDFAGAPDASRLHINDWIATQTEQRIKDLIPPRGVTVDTRLVLANAIYFLGTWAHPFKKEETRPAPFHVATTSAKNVPTMHALEDLRFAHTDGVKVLEVPYAGGELAMAFVLPDAIDGLDAVESRLTPAALAGWLGALAGTRVQIALPRFKVDPPGALALRDVLASLGMPLAFDPKRADFTGIANPPRPDERLFVGDVFHKAFVKVDEQGTEAAAATAVTMRAAMAMRREPPPADFTADHPFLFVLREVASGTILFLGRVGDPS